jgi:hypothetical protein
MVSAMFIYIKNSKPYSMVLKEYTGLFASALSKTSTYLGEVFLQSAKVVK